MFDNNRFLPSSLFGTFSQKLLRIHAEKLMIVDRWYFLCRQGIIVADNLGNNLYIEWRESREPITRWLGVKRGETIRVICWWVGITSFRPGQILMKTSWTEDIIEAPGGENHGCMLVSQRGVRRQINGDYSPQTRQHRDRAKDTGARGGFMAGHYKSLPGILTGSLTEEVWNKTQHFFCNHETSAY